MECSPYAAKFAPRAAPGRGARFIFGSGGLARGCAISPFPPGQLSASTQHVAPLAGVVDYPVFPTDGSHTQSVDRDNRWFRNGHLEGRPCSGRGLAAIVRYYSNSARSPSRGETLETVISHYHHRVSPERVPRRWYWQCEADVGRLGPCGPAAPAGPRQKLQDESNQAVSPGDVRVFPIAENGPQHLSGGG